MAVDVLPASATSLLVAFEPSTDDGGKPITHYKVEWDAIGLEGYRNGGSPSNSLLYSGVDVQVVEVSATKNDIGGYFTLAYRSVVRGKCLRRLFFPYFVRNLNVKAAFIMYPLDVLYPCKERLLLGILYLLKPTTAQPPPVECFDIIPFSGRNTIPTFS